MNQLEGGCLQTIFLEKKIARQRTVGCWQQKRAGCGLAQFQPSRSPGHSLLSSLSMGVPQLKILAEFWEGENILSANKIAFWFIQCFPCPFADICCVFNDQLGDYSFQDNTCAKPFKLWFCFSVLYCPVSDSTFSPYPAYSVDNVFPFNFVRQTQGILIPSPSPGEEQPTSGGHSRLEDLF